MAKLWYLVEIVLLFAILKPIVCANGDILANRREDQLTIKRVERSNFDNNSSDSTSDSNSSELQRSKESKHEVRAAATDTNHKNAEWSSIFNLGPGNGVVLFSTPTSTTPRTPGSDIVYPGQFASKPRFDPLKNDQPEITLRNDGISCDDGTPNSKSYCTKVADYPDLSVVKSQIQNDLSKFSIFFMEEKPASVDIVQRMQLPDEHFLCQSVEKVIHPRKGETVKAEELYIINDDKLRQGVRVEECGDSDRPCRHMNSLPIGYISSCRQIYHYRQLAAIGRDGNATVDFFKLPSCCKCVVKQVPGG